MDRAGTRAETPVGSQESVVGSPKESLVGSRESVVALLDRNALTELVEPVQNDDDATVRAGSLFTRGATAQDTDDVLTIWHRI